MLDFSAIKAAAVSQFKLPSSSIHGLDHWERVSANGLKICETEPEADRVVVECFAYLHDCERQSDGHDPEHGPRAAVYCATIRGTLLKALTDQQFTQLVFAIKHHTEGGVFSDDTIGSCWDADRLDLSRVGISPSVSFMSTKTGRKMAAPDVLDGEVIAPPLRFLYHGTTSQHCPQLFDLFKKGILPRGERPGERWNVPDDILKRFGDLGGSNPKAVYLSALSSALFLSLAPLATPSGDNKPFQAFVVEIDAAKLDEARFMPDEIVLSLDEQQRHETLELDDDECKREMARQRQRMETERHLWRKCYDRTGIIAHQGRVAPEAFSRVLVFNLSFFVERPDLAAVLADPKNSRLPISREGAKKMQSLLDEMFSPPSPGEARDVFDGQEILAKLRGQIYLKPATLPTIKPIIKPFSIMSRRML
jgi:uncharacterized protein